MTPIMQNHMDKKMDHEMVAHKYIWDLGSKVLDYLDGPLFYFVK